MVSITTIFTPPPSCTSVFTRSGDLVWQGGVAQTGDVDCFPPGFAKILNSFYSPGICPSGWTSAGALSGTGALVFNPRETNAMCCPRGYEMAANIQLQGSSFGGIFCRSTMPATLTNVFATSTLSDGAVPPAATLDTAVASNIANPYVWEDIIQVRWQSTDTQILQLLSASSTTTSTSISTPASAAPKITTSNATDTAAESSSVPSGGGLSTGQIVGVIIGCLAAGVLLCLGAFVLVRRYRRRRIGNKGGHFGSELPGGSIQAAFIGAADYGPPKELHASSIPAELPTAETGTWRYELPANSPATTRQA